jgi:hypothetical protein
VSTGSFRRIRDRFEFCSPPIMLRDIRDLAEDPPVRIPIPRIFSSKPARPRPGVLYDLWYYEALREIQAIYRQRVHDVMTSYVVYAKFHLAKQLDQDTCTGFAENIMSFL